MYAKNICTFLLNLVKDKQIQINLEDEIIRDTLIARDGQVVNPRIKPLLDAAATFVQTAGRWSRHDCCVSRIFLRERIRRIDVTRSC